MLTEKDYCDYDTCVALKELGFREKCPTYYDIEDNVGLLYNTQWTSDYLPCQFTDCLESHNSNISDDNSYVDAPNLYEAQKWLREKGIVIDITFSPFGYFASIYTNARQVESEHLKGCFKFQWDDKVYADSESFTYEEALLEGVKAAVNILKEEK